MEWDGAHEANKKLYDLLTVCCREEALTLAEQHEGQGFEAWRQLQRRYDPRGGQNELQRMRLLMNPKPAKDLEHLPGVIDKFENDMRAYEERSGKTFPPEWKVMAFMSLIPSSHQKEFETRYQVGMKDYRELSTNVLNYAQEARAKMRGRDDMEVDMFDDDDDEDEDVEDVNYMGPKGQRRPGAPGPKRRPQPKAKPAAKAAPAPPGARKEDRICFGATRRDTSSKSAGDS